MAEESAHAPKHSRVCCCTRCTGSYGLFLFLFPSEHLGDSRVDANMAECRIRCQATWVYSGKENLTRSLYSRGPPLLVFLHTDRTLQSTGVFSPALPPFIPPHWQEGHWHVAGEAGYHQCINWEALCVRHSIKMSISPHFHTELKKEKEEGTMQKSQCHLIHSCVKRWSGVETKRWYSNDCIYK